MDEHLHRFRAPYAPSPRAVDDLARGLGWFSVALGAMELFGAERLARALGMEGRETLIRAFGLRELVAGGLILGSENPEPGVISRIAGDALDLAVLAAERDPHDPRRRNVDIALAAVAGVTLLDIYCAKALDDERRAVRPHM